MSFSFKEICKLDQVKCDIIILRQRQREGTAQVMKMCLYNLYKTESDILSLCEKHGRQAVQWKYRSDKENLFVTWKPSRIWFLMF